MMSSKEIAELTGKQHQHVLRDCDNLNANYLKMSLLKIEQTITNHPYNKNQHIREMFLTKMQCFDLLTGYNAELRIKVNRRWAELEAKQYRHDVEKRRLRINHLKMSLLQIEGGIKSGNIQNKLKYLKILLNLILFFYI